MSKIIKITVLLVGAILIALIVRTVIASASHPSTPTVTTQKVRVSAADLPQGLLLRDDDLSWKNIPAAEVPPNAIVADDVILPNSPGFLAATLKPGMRAVSVAVDDVSGNAGLIQPGDYVDLLLTQQMDRRTESPDLAVSSETVVQQVRVLAVGSEISRPKTSDAPDANSRARTVTLEVTPRMGEVVSVAARLGSLSLALRSFATAMRDPDTTTAEPVSAASQAAPVWAGDISRALRELPKSRPQQVNAMSAPSAPAAPRAVIIYRGSDTSDPSAVVAQGNGGAAYGPPPLPPTTPVH